METNIALLELLEEETFKHGSPMFHMFRKPVSVLDEKSNKAIM
jgi:hypothetical protein